MAPSSGGDRGPRPICPFERWLKKELRALAQIGEADLIPLWGRRNGEQSQKQIVQRAFVKDEHTGRDVTSWCAETNFGKFGAGRRSRRLWLHLNMQKQILMSRHVFSHGLANFHGCKLWSSAWMSGFHFGALYPCEPAGRQQADCEAWAKTAGQIGGLRETLSSFGLPCAELPYDCHDEVNCPTIAQVTAAFLHETTEPAVGATVGLDDPSERGFHFLQSLLSRFGLPEGSQQTTLDEEAAEHDFAGAQVQVWEVTGSQAQSAVHGLMQREPFPCKVCDLVQHEPFPCELVQHEPLPCMVPQEPFPCHQVRHEPFPCELVQHEPFACMVPQEPFPCNQVQHEPFPCKLQAREELLSHEADFEPWAAGLYHDSTWRSGEKCCDEVILESTTLDLEIEPLCIDQGAPRTQEVEVLTWRRSLRQEVVGGPNCERCPSEPDFFCLRGCLRFLEGSFWGSSLGRACSHDPHVGERVGEAAHPGPVQASECAESGAQHQLRDRQQTHASEYAFAVALGDDSVVKGHVSSGSDSSGVQLQSRDVQQIQAFNCGDEELSRLTVGNAEQQCPQSVQTSSDLMLDFLTTHSRTPGVQACCDLREFSQTGTFHVTRAPTEVTQLRCRLAASEFDYEAWAELRHKLFMTDVPYELDDDTAVRGLSASCTCLVSLLPPLGFRPRPFGPLGGFVSVPLHASFRFRLRAQPCPHSGDEKLSGLTADYAEQPCLQSAQTSSEPMLDLLTMHSRTPGVQACHDLRMLSQTGIFHVTSTLTETAQLQCTTADSEFDYEAMAEFRRQLLPTEVPYTLDGTQDLPVKIKTLVQKLQLLEVFGRCTNELFRLGHLAHRLNNEVLVVPPPDTVKSVATNLEATQQQLEDGQQAVGEARSSVDPHVVVRDAFCTCRVSLSSPLGFRPRPLGLFGGLAFAFLPAPFRFRLRTQPQLCPEVAATGAVVKSIACLQEFTASVQLPWR